ncbi:RPS25D, partial [Symbiodinium sp. KB8]
ATYDKMLKEIPKAKLITPSVVSERLKVNGSVARVAIRHLEEKNMIMHVGEKSSKQMIYTRKIGGNVLTELRPDLFCVVAVYLHPNCAAACCGTTPPLRSNDFVYCSYQAWGAEVVLPSKDRIRLLAGKFGGDRHWEPGWDSKNFSFPSYQSIQVDVSSDSARGTGSATPGQPTGPMHGLQQLLNAARKAEQRVSKLHQQKEKAHLQWKAYDEKMKQEFLREKKKFGQNMERLDREISEALLLQEQARLRVFGVPATSSQDIAAPMEDEDTSWEHARETWERESAQDLDGVMERAVAQARAAGLTPCTPVRARPVQAMTPNTRLVDTVGAGAPALVVDPYLAAVPEAAPAPSFTPPGTAPCNAGRPPGLEAPLHRQVPKHPGQRDASVPRQPTSAGPPRNNIKDATKGPPPQAASGLTLSEKLEMKRAAESQGRAMLPFGGAAHHAAAMATTPAPSIVDDDNDLDEEVDAEQEHPPGL